ncbi:MAG: hypothetical protein CMD01_03420 [Flavobacteriales bacterium]|nr:hypothetical protein [Flavobacteriales bacterium]
MMIPTHDSEKTQRKEIIVERLKKLNAYDFTRPHRHNYFELFFFLKGGGYHKIDFIDFPIKAGSVHIVAPGQVHQMKRELDSEGFVVLFELNALEAPLAIQDFLFEHICMDASEKKPSYSFSENETPTLNSKIKSIWELFNNKDDLSKLSLRNEIQSLCIACMRMVKEPVTRKQSEYMHFRKLLHSNFSTIKKVKEYAAKLGITEKTLNEIVKKSTGQSASSIIYKQLIMEAKRLLNTNISIKETAYSLNFDDPAHFSKFFKTQTGISPSEFQNYT